ncbi:MAG TPA: hypothetical protein VFV75_08555, partial [Candidatus Polarisedimenticolaceae bacterium]|nr:hypothetical protein [Candidatus Polarisedimenticolaceae bacterium]
VKIQRVVANEHKRAFEVQLEDRTLSFPYFKATPRPTRMDRVHQVKVRMDLAHRGFTYVLASGRHGAVHLDRVFDDNEPPRHTRDVLVYKLTLEARTRVAATELSKREIIRRLKTSPAQLSRILDTSNYRKSVDQVLALLQVLDCEIDVVVRDKDR